MNLSDPKTWIDGFWVVVSAPHIVVPLLVAVGSGVWWFRGTVEKSKRDGLQTIIKGRDNQITGLNTQMSIVQERLDNAKEQQSYLAKRLADAETEIAKLKQQIEDRAAPELLRATVNSTARIVGEIATLNTRLGNTVSNPDLFDRRFKIYKTVKDCVDQVIRNPLYFDNEQEKEFLEAVNDADFLFGDDVHDYLEKLRKDIVFVRDTTKHQTGGVKREQAMGRINSFYETGQPLFAEYMRFTQPVPHN